MVDQSDHGLQYSEGVHERHEGHSNPQYNSPPAMPPSQGGIGGDPVQAVPAQDQVVGSNQDPKAASEINQAATTTPPSPPPDFDEESLAALSAGVHPQVPPHDVRDQPMSRGLFGSTIEDFEAPPRGYIARVNDMFRPPAGLQPEDRSKAASCTGSNEGSFWT